jgi:2-polyprenyl-3-methyl-5-hydroxy-6-metoxy-1,4-benzoquinol methylase
MNVSVIIPAHNAADTLAETLESLRAQTFTDWEAIVVDDGSTDETVAIATSFARKDSRIRITSQTKMGVSTARNKGISLARNEWLLFLDADDLILPQHLERMTHALVSDPRLDAVHCAWARITQDGTRFKEKYCSESGNLFPFFAHTCVFSIHACIIRRSIVEHLGGFDTSLITCEGWDLWQRIARTGARFGAINEVLSLYRMRQASASNNGFRFLTDGLLVIERGHSADPRVPNPLPENASGMPATQLPGKKLYFTCWSAGLVFGRGEDARPLLNVLNGVHDPGLDPDGVANCIFEAALFPICQPPTAWDKLWLRIEQHIKEFLFAFEKQSMSPGLAHRTIFALQRLIFEHATTPRPFTAGTIYAIRVEVTVPISDIITPKTSERLHCNVEIEGNHVGMIELPICDGIVPSYILTDAIASEFAWQIIGKFFEYAVYPNLSIKREQKGVSVWRGNLRIAEVIHGEEYIVRKQMHELIGWIVFLQEIFGCCNLSMDGFYTDYRKLSLKKNRLLNLKSSVKEINWKIFNHKVCKRYFKSYAYFLKRKRIKQYILNGDWITIEVSEELFDIVTTRKKFNVVLTVGGVAIGVVTIPVKENIVYAQELQVALTKASGYELCCSAVREGLLGKSLSDATSLHERLYAAAKTKNKQIFQFTETPSGIKIVPGSACAINQLLFSNLYGVVLGRHAYDVIGTSVSRRAVFPAATTSEISDAALSAGEPVFRLSVPKDDIARVVYAPDLVWRQSQSLQKKPEKKLIYGSPGYFEKLFAMETDPWKYTSPYEQTKYEQTLAMLPPVRIKRALELACAEGHFTAQLAPRVNTLIAADVSQVALDRAAHRCAGMNNVCFQRTDFINDTIPGRFELIVCSEVLYFVDGLNNLEIVARKLAKAILPGGYLLTAHANLVVDDPDHTGFEWGHQFGAKVIGETLEGTRLLQLVKEYRTPLYRIQLFQRVGRIRSIFYRQSPEVAELKYQPTSLLPEVAACVRWRSGGPSHSSIGKNAVTSRLPILMYHRVAPNGSASTARYRVIPEQFEEQLHYLQNEGYYSINLEDWFFAMERKKPLLGKAVVLTFDDGYLDFKTYAWPLLKQLLIDLAHPF